MQKAFTILQSLSDPVIVVNGRGDIVFANDPFNTLLGYDEGELEGEKLSRLIPAKQRNVHDTHLSGYFTAPQKRKMGEGNVFEALHKSGAKVPVEVSLSPLELDNESFTLAILADVREKLKVESELNANRLFYLSLLEHNTDHIFQLDTEMRIRYINFVAPGLKKENVMGMPVMDFLPDGETKARVKKTLEYAFQTGEAVSYDVDYPSPDGIIHYATSATPIKEGDEVIGINLISRDITREVKTQRKLLEHKSFIDRLNDHSLNGLFIYDIEMKRNSYINKRYTEILGYTLADIHSFSVEAFMRLFHPDDLETIQKHMEEITSLKEGEHVEVEYRFKAKDGHWVWCLSRDTGFEYDADGNMLSFIGSFIDLTRQKRVEDTLRQKSKEIENFVYTASHDIKSPLNSISQALELVMLTSGDLPEDIVNLLGAAQQSADRLKALVVSLLDHSMLQENKALEQVDCNDLVHGVLIDLQHSIVESDAQINVNKLPEQVTAYQVPLRQLFQNLLSNALKYKKPYESAKVEINCEESTDHYLFILEDNGIGIPDEHKHKIFDMFYRIPQSGIPKSNGIGLANCVRAVELHKGKIWVESEYGKGSAFAFTVKKL